MPIIRAERAMISVHLLPSLIPPGGLHGGVAVVIDVLRASTMMVHALVAGCTAVMPCGEVDEARRLAASLPEGSSLLAGERHGVAIAGFRSGKFAGRMHARGLPGKDDGHHHDQRHSRPAGLPGCRSRPGWLVRQFRGDLPAPAARGQADSSGLRRHRGTSQL